MKIKGFDKDLKGRGFQFEIGKTYDTGAKELKLCTCTVFHYCDSLQNVHEFYNCKDNNRYCEIKVLGDEVTDGIKYGSNKIKIVREIVGDELNSLKGLDNGNSGLFNTGNRNTGNWNTGNWNTGNRNTGNRNTGNWNTGNRNTGNCNTGNCNTGGFNACWFSNGYFNTVDLKINIFNLPTDMTAEEFQESEYYQALIEAPFALTEWIEYTGAEKKADKQKELIGGYLKTYTYKKACANWWAKLSEAAKQTIKSMPNFSAKIFKEITGIEVEE